MIKCLSAIVFLVFIQVEVYSQNWGGGVDQETLHFGFTFQHISSEYKIYKKADWQMPFPSEAGGFIPAGSPDGDLLSISSPITPGFGLGFVTDLKLNNHLNLRLTPALAFTDRTLDYNYKDSVYFQSRKLQATMVDLPLGIKLKSDKVKNFRAYLIGGIKYSRDIISKKKTDNTLKGELDKIVKNNRSILSYEAGIGLDLYFEFFKLSPEIKLSNSFGDVLTPEDHAYSRPLDKLFLRNLQFSLYFE